MLLVEAGRAIDTHGIVKKRYLVGRLSLEAASELGKVLDDELLARCGTDWVREAETVPVPEFRRRVKEKRIELTNRGPAVRLTATLTARGDEAFRRARDLASRKAKRYLDHGETIETLAEHYLDSFDPDRKEPRTRRMPDTTGRPGRHLPAAVRRQVRNRARRGRWVYCQHPHCWERIWLQYAHLVPHAAGGSREACNIVLLCNHHHMLYDLGVLRIEGTVDDLRFLSMIGGKWIEARAPPSSG